MGFTSKLQGRKILTCCKFLQFKLISYSFWNIRRKVLFFFYKFDEKRSNHQTHFWKRTIQWLFHQNFVLIEQMVSDKNCLWEFPIGSYVKLSSAVAAILVGVLKWRTQFRKRTTQESFQQSLVEIGSVVSEEKIF